MNIKINLVLDGNYLLYKNVFILKKTRTIKQDLKDLMMSDIKRIKNIFSFDNIYFTSDSKAYSWRKSIYEEYKGNREKDTTIDWDFVFSVYNEFKNELENLNVKVLELNNLEGDDIISYLIKKTNEEGYSNVVISSDSDLLQLLEFDLNKEYINIQWNYKYNNSIVYLPINYQLMIKKFTEISENSDLFNLNNNDEFVTFFEDLITKNVVHTVDKNEVALNKIVTGDDGDNIPSIVKTKSGKIDETGRGIGKDGAKTVYNIYKDIYSEELNIDSDEFIDRLINVIVFYKKLEDNESNKNFIKTNLLLNRKLIYLNNDYIPKSLLENLEILYEEVKNKKFIKPILNKEEEDYFSDKKIEIIPEQFSKESTGEKFNPDLFWSI